MSDFFCIPSSAAQRKSDSLQDRIDALEREKEGTEQSLEEAVIQVLHPGHFGSTSGTMFLCSQGSCAAQGLHASSFLLDQAEIVKAELEELEDERKKVRASVGGSRLCSHR